MSDLVPHDELERHSYSERMQAMRETEYPMLQGTYLDHAGTTLPSKSLISMFAEEMTATLLANPHSSSSVAPNASHEIVEETRLRVLQLFKADAEEFDLVFVANATAGIKLVLEAFTGHDEGFDHFYHRDCHTSLVGLRELAARSHCFQSDKEVETWLKNGERKRQIFTRKRPQLFVYPAQSNMNGRRAPLDWCSKLRASSKHPQAFSLLDVAGLVATSPLDLSDHANAPDFLVLSFYKSFGFPDLGALIVRKASSDVFEKRRYFGGGTTEMITCFDKPWVARKESSLHARLEDGTGATHSILALSCALRSHQQLYGGFKNVSAHTLWLSQCAYEKLTALRHANGRAVCEIYKDEASTYGDAKTQGPIVALNIRRSDGSWVGSAEVGRRAAERNIHIRTGSLCNPGGMAQALQMSSDAMKRAFDSGYRCGEDAGSGMRMGMVRISFGAMSVYGDLEIFVRFVQECFVETAKEDRPLEKVRTPRDSGVDLCAPKVPVKRGRRSWRAWLLRVCSW